MSKGKALAIGSNAAAISVHGGTGPAGRYLKRPPPPAHDGSGHGR
jgi:hypothetical protein